MTLSAAAVNVNLLKGGTTTINGTVGNAAGSSDPTGASTDTLNWSVTGAVSGSGTGLAAGNTSPVSASYTGSAYSPSSSSPTAVTITATATNTTLLTTAANSGVTASANVNVGWATADLTGVQTLFGTPLTAAVDSGASLAGLASKTANSLGTEATFLAGTTASAGTVSMSWRAATGADAMNGQPILGDVANLSTPTGANPFALEMSFNPAELGGKGANTAFLAWLNGSNQWVNAVTGNAGNNATSPEMGYVGTFGSFQTANGTTLSSYIGAYGVDTSNDLVWAVVNHNSQFAVAAGAVPEPAALALLASGLLGLLAYAWRKRK